MVKSAITRPHDVHAVITGDADLVPAINVAYPEYSILKRDIPDTVSDEINPILLLNARQYVPACLIGTSCEAFNS